MEALYTIVIFLFLFLRKRMLIALKHSSQHIADSNSAIAFIPAESLAVEEVEFLQKRKEILSYTMLLQPTPVYCIGLSVELQPFSLSVFCLS